MNKKERLWGKALMKRIGSLLLILAMVLTTLPFTPKYEVKAAGTGTTLYLQPNENWKEDNARLNKIAARWPAKAVAQFYFY